MNKIILASSSPRRKELLSLVVPDFSCVAASIDESSEGFDCPRVYCIEMARRKSLEVSQKFPERLVIASDTIVALDGNILGKPKDYKEAFGMLRAMSGKTHEVLTSVVIRQNERVDEKLFTTRVTFFELTDEEIAHYIETENVYDKAGSYGIQGSARLFVKEIHGNFDTIVGFPIGYVKRMLEDFQK